MADYLTITIFFYINKVGYSFGGGIFMVKHITMYQLSNKSMEGFVVEQLKKLEECPLIVKNRICVSFEKNLPIIGKPMFADIVYIAYFYDEDGAKMFPICQEHLDLVEEISPYVENVMSIDFIDE